MFLRALSLQGGFKHVRVLCCLKQPPYNENFFCFSFCSQVANQSYAHTPSMRLQVGLMRVLARVGESESCKAPGPNSFTARHIS